MVGASVEMTGSGMNETVFVTESPVSAGPTRRKEFSGRLKPNEGIVIDRAWGR